MVVPGRLFTPESLPSPFTCFGASIKDAWSKHDGPDDAMAEQTSQRTTTLPAGACTRS